MCAIIGWNGQLPPGLLFQMLRAAEFRGRHSTGICSFDAESSRNLSLKDAVPASVFVTSYRSEVSAAGRSRRGIAHVRNASLGMPINSHNAHPFKRGDLWYAHNGAVKNWRTLRGSDETITTDSMVLGKHIESGNFSALRGSFGLVWILGAKVFAARSAKELCGIKITWQSPAGTKISYAVVSVFKIAEDAKECLANAAEVNIENIDLDENFLYDIRADGIFAVKQLDFSNNNSQDSASSAAC